MHISIPDSEEVVETKPGSTTTDRYVSYNIHINGTYHCSVRYSQLEKLHERLKNEFGVGCLEKFPTKSFFYMKPDQAHYRRYQLQRWIQRIGSQPLIVKGETFQSFLLNAQKEVQKGPEVDVQLEIFLVNGKSIKVDIVSTDQTDDVLETACQVIELDPALTYYFGLYLVTDLSGKFCVRKLQDFESPHISLMRADPSNKIMLRKAYWDPRIDKALYGCPIALNLIYIQAIADIKNGWISVADNVADDLANFRAQKDREAFLDAARKLKGYGIAQFGKATANVPKEGSAVTCGLGPEAFYIIDANGAEHSFFVPRIRCWRTYTVEEGVEMEFEYYFDPAAGQKEGRMGWVKLVSTQTIHMAMCLQQLVEEMIRLKKGLKIKTPADRVGRFKPRRQESKPADLTFLTSDATAPISAAPKNESNPTSPTSGSQPSSPVKKVSVTLSDLISKVKVKEDDDVDDEPVDYSSLAPASASKAGKAKEDPDDYESDEDGARAFAKMAGF